ncbi:MAG: iron-sulfur cluster biosynthesis family protein [Caloramator sp.]|jgi:Fe-S cluster assembly iron-binding protein IscA|nr:MULTISPECIES: iron-sulfur cluster biosynthesis family protein [Caloramator]MCX7694450.1 iron-sulfur cluster biosynthesis family protein [Caloramator sp.]
MEIKITQSAAEELKKKLEGKDQNIGVRVYIAGVG